MARYVPRFGEPQGRVAKAVLYAIPPLMLKTQSNPGGLPIDVLDGLRKVFAANRAQFSSVCQWARSMASTAQALRSRRGRSKIGGVRAWSALRIRTAIMLPWRFRGRHGSRWPHART